jgi:hypothetical protein
MISDAFVCFDYSATPTLTDDGHGGTYPAYPPLAGVFAITDLATFARSSDALSPYRVTQVPAQHVLGGDDPANPTLTVTLQFPDQATFDAVTGPVNALPPIAYSPSDPAPQPANPRVISLLDFKLRIPAAKAMAILAARTTDPEIAYADELINSVGGPNGPVVNLDDPLVRQYVGDLVLKGYLTADDQAAILA